MSTLFSRGGVWYVGVPTRPDGWAKRSTGTKIKALASSMARMMDELGPRGRRSWNLLEAVLDGRISVPTLHDAFQEGPAALERLNSELNDRDVNQVIPQWLSSLDDHVALDTIQHYSTHVRTFIPENQRFPIARLNKSDLARWQQALPCSSATKRKYRAAMSSLCEFLISGEMLAVNPMRQIKAPKASKPRMRHLEHSQVIELVEAQAEPFRTISSLMHATGMEISAVLKIKRGDIDLQNWMIRAHGTKTASRDRQAYLMVWARAYLVAHIRDLLPGALVFPGVTRWAPSESHSRACRKLGIEDYTLRDSRHTFAVGAAKAGVPAELIARQLGHADTQMVNRVYMRYQPSQAEMAKMFERADDRLASDGNG